MIVTRLKITNLRAMETAEFRFQPGFNLIVGVNGVGKSSVLDALVVCLSAAVKQANKLRTRVEAFATDDIRVGAEALTVECGFRCGDEEHTYLVHKPRETSAPQMKKAGMPREQVHDTPERNEFLGKAPAPVSEKAPGGRPLAVLFSTNRAVPTERAPAKSAAAGGVAAAFADAFARRELRLGEFADWMRVQQSLRKERPAAARVLSAFESTVERFLPDYTDLRLDGEDGRQLWIKRGKTAMPVRQLSDGERGILALVLDLTRRLAQANPHLDDPSAEAEAVVLIDEIDLHLHPKWQRQIVHNLREAFPRCQFIATTHSPQVIGEVEHERIQIMADGLVYSPPHSYGVDSSRVLEELMNAEPRTKAVKELLSQISQAIGKQQHKEARQLLARLVEQIGETDPEVTRLRTLLDFVEGNE
ncbi:MAG: AAA family ATPase [Desulfobulbaceae bacterium]